MKMTATIEEKLNKAFSPDDLKVLNESDQHAGHASSPGTGESHFRIKLTSGSFTGKTRLERHRMINEVLSEELAGKIHALAVEAKAPGEVG